MPKTLEELQSDLETLRGDFDSHIHDGSSSKSFETLQAQTIVGHTILIKKSAYNDTQTGIWMGFVDSTFKMVVGDATNSLSWNGSTLSIIGSITGSTIIGGTIETAASGARIVMAGIDNTLRIYDATSQVVGMGTDAGIAISITPTAGTNNGVLIQSAINGNGFYYTNSTDISNRGIYVAQLSSGSNNSLPAIHIIQAGVGQALFIDARNTATAIYLQNAGIGVNIDIVHSVSSASAITGIRFNLANSGAGKEYAMDFTGSEFTSSSVGGSQDKKINVKVSGTDYYIPLYTA
jgi:hypothetical protein